MSNFPKRSVTLVLDIYLDIWNYPFHRKVANTEVTNLYSFWSLFALESSRASFAQVNNNMMVDHHKSVVSCKTAVKQVLEQKNANFSDILAVGKIIMDFIFHCLLI